MIFTIDVKLGSLKLRDASDSITVERLEYVESIDDLDAMTAEFSIAADELGSLWSKIQPSTVYTVQFSNAKTGAPKGDPIKGTVVDVQFELVGNDRCLVTVIGLEDLVKLRGSAVEVSWEDAPDKIVKAIAQAGGLTADADASNVVKYRVDRGGMDDARFLKVLANKFHYRVGMVSGKLAFKRRSVVDATVDVKDDDLLGGARLGASVDGLATEVTVWGRDPKQNGWFSEKVSSVPRGISGTDMGTALAKKVFKSAAIEIRDAGCPTPGAAQERATAEFRQRAERYVQGTLDVTGNPDIRTGTDIKLVDSYWPFKGKYRVRQVRHIEDATGYRTSVDFYSDSMPMKA